MPGSYICLVFGSEDRKLYSSASTWVGFLLLSGVVAGSLHDGVIPEVATPGSADSTAEDLDLLRRREWASAEETYGLFRPDPNEDVVYVHRQTTTRVAIAPVTWDPIPVGHNVLPAEILDDTMIFMIDGEKFRGGSAGSTGHLLCPQSQSSATQIMCLSRKMTMSRLTGGHMD